MSDILHNTSQQTADPRKVVQQYLDKVTPSAQLSHAEQEKLKQRVKQLLQAKNAVIVAHYYTDPLIQALAEETGGIVADSLEMARFGHNHKLKPLWLQGSFMGETAKILTDKQVLMPTLRQPVPWMWVVQLSFFCLL